ncbi:hypothetical protein D3C85_1648050 [compost metagenome]
MFEHIFDQRLQRQANHAVQQIIRVDANIDFKFTLVAVFHNGHKIEHVLQLVGDRNFLQIGADRVAQHIRQRTNDIFDFA